MIIRNGGVAIDISQLRAIKTEFLSQGGNLIFELNNLVIPIEDPDTREQSQHSFPNEAVEVYIEASDSLRAYFDECVDLWKEYKTR